MPNLFAERVRNKIRRDFDGHIPYDNLNYGALVNAYIKEGLSLCNDLKLKNQLKSQRLTKQKELGDFCEQFAIGPSYKKDKIFEQPSKGKEKKFSKKKKFFKKQNADPKEFMDCSLVLKIIMFRTINKRNN